VYPRAPDIVKLTCCSRSRLYCRNMATRSEPAGGVRADTSMVTANVAMCAYAFDVISSKLKVPTRSGANGSPERFPDAVPDATGVGVFVTFNERDDPMRSLTGYALRGCIGTLSPTDLRPALRRYAAYSAFEDSRFSPITRGELPNLQAAVSVLSGFSQAQGGVYDWTIGVHGIILDLYPKGPSGRKYSATYLPEVCAEQGWSKEECIESLARKSGYRGPLTPAVLDTAELTVYVSTKAVLTYEDYLQS
jgi:AMME syndrome candidate gene 1 protein